MIRQPLLRAAPAACSAAKASRHRPVLPAAADVGGTQMFKQAARPLPDHPASSSTRHTPSQRCGLRSPSAGRPGSRAQLPLPPLQQPGRGWRRAATRTCSCSWPRRPRRTTTVAPRPAGAAPPPASPARAADPAGRACPGQPRRPQRASRARCRQGTSRDRRWCWRQGPFRAWRHRRRRRCSRYPPPRRRQHPSAEAWPLSARRQPQLEVQEEPPRAALRTWAKAHWWSAMQGSR